MFANIICGKNLLFKLEKCQFKQMLKLHFSLGLRDSIRNTSTNIFPIPKIEEERKKKGILRLFSRKKKDVSFLFFFIFHSLYKILKFL